MNYGRIIGLQSGLTKSEFYYDEQGTELKVTDELGRVVEGALTTISRHQNLEITG